MHNGWLRLRRWVFGTGFMAVTACLAAAALSGALDWMTPGRAIVGMIGGAVLAWEAFTGRLPLYGSLRVQLSRFLTRLP